MSSQRLSILIYHRVLARPDRLLPSLPDVRQFNRQMALLKRCFRVLPLSVAIRLLQRRALPARAACITFDDGYADNVEHALPVLQRYGLHATFFIASAYLDGGQMWNDDIIDHARQNGLDCAALDQLLTRIKYLPFDERLRAASAMAPPRRSELMMRTSQVEALATAGMEIGAHTHWHPILSAMAGSAALADIAHGKATLEDITQRPVTLFAYPNGKPATDYQPCHVEMVRQLGFAAACSTVAGTAHQGSDLLQLPRFTPWERDAPRFLLRLLAQRRHPV